MKDFDISELSLKILSCVFRAEEKYGNFLIASTLCGSKNKKVKEFNLDKLSTYGIVNNLSIPEVISVINFLKHLGLLFRSTEHKNICLTQKGRSFLIQKPKLFIPQTILDQAKEPLFVKKLPPTHLYTLSLWINGYSLSEIAKQKQLKEVTIENHIANLVYHKKITDITKFITNEKIELIQEVITKIGFDSLKRIKVNLPEEITYGQIRIVLANWRSHDF